MLANGVKYSVERNYINLTNIAFTGDKVSNDLKCIYLSFNSTSQFPWAFDQRYFPYSLELLLFFTSSENNGRLSEGSKAKHSWKQRTGERKKKANRVFPPQRILIPRLIDARAAIVRG